VNSDVKCQLLRCIKDYDLSSVETTLVHRVIACKNENTNFKKESKSCVKDQRDKKYSPCFIFNGKDYPKAHARVFLVDTLKTYTCTR
jgi:hypothetical protein